MKQKQVAGLLAITLGIFGTHRFYLGQRFLGVVYFLLFWGGLAATIEDGNPIIMLLPVFISLVDCAVFFAMPGRDFDNRYNRHVVDTQESYAPSIDLPNQSRKSFAAWKAEGIRHFRAHHFEDAAEAFLHALKMSPKDPAICFNLACCYSMLQQSQEGFHYLNTALDYGFEDIDKIQNHPALAFLRQHPEFPLQDTAQQKPATPVIEEEPEKPEPILQLEELKNRGILTEAEFQTQLEKMQLDNRL